MIISHDNFFIDYNTTTHYATIVCANGDEVKGRFDHQSEFEQLGGNKSPLCDEATNAMRAWVDSCDCLADAAAQLGASLEDDKTVFDVDVNQDWDNETTTYVYEDGSRLVFGDHEWWVERA